MVFIIDLVRKLKWHNKDEDDGLPKFEKENGQLCISMSRNTDYELMNYGYTRRSWQPVSELLTATKCTEEIERKLMLLIENDKVLQMYNTVKDGNVFRNNVLEKLNEDVQEERTKSRQNQEQIDKWTDSQNIVMSEILTGVRAERTRYNLNM